MRALQRARPKAAAISVELLALVAALQHHVAENAYQRVGLRYQTQEAARKELTAGLADE